MSLARDFAETGMLKMAIEKKLKELPEYQLIEEYVKLSIRFKKLSKRLKKRAETEPPYIPKPINIKSISKNIS